MPGYREKRGSGEGGRRALGWRAARGRNGKYRVGAAAGAGRPAGSRARDGIPSCDRITAGAGHRGNGAGGRRNAARAAGRTRKGGRKENAAGGMGAYPCFRRLGIVVHRAGDSP